MSRHDASQVEEQFPLFLKIDTSLSWFPWEKELVLVYLYILTMFFK